MGKLTKLPHKATSFVPACRGSGHRVTTHTLLVLCPVRGVPPGHPPRFPPFIPGEEPGDVTKSAQTSTSSPLKGEAW